MKQWLAVLAGLGALGGAAVALAAWAGSERGIHPHPIDPEYTPSDFELELEAVRFRSNDGTELAGWWAAGTRQAAVVLAHGYASRREEMLPHAAFLHKAGYGVLLFDFRAMGESGGDVVTVGALERLDVHGAVAYTRSRIGNPDGPIFGLGVSMGASALILAAGESSELRAVVAECPFRSVNSAIAESFTYFTGLPAFPCAPLTVWFAERKVGFRARDVRPDRAVCNMGDRGLLLIHGSADTILSASNSQAIYAAANGHAQLWMVEDAAHAKAYQADPEAYRKRILDFFGTWPDS